MTETQADALAAFLRDRGAQLRGLAFGMTGNWPDADDLVQIAASRLADHWGEIDDRGAMGWATKVMKNAWKDERRSARRLLTVSIDARAEDEEQPFGEMLEDPMPGPEDQARLADIAERVREALGALSPQHQAVLAKRGLEALPYRDIARVLDIIGGTVKSRVHRAAARARRLLAEDPR